jgi:hypothetical protein
MTIAVAKTRHLVVNVYEGYYAEHLIPDWDVSEIMPHHYSMDINT